MTLIAHITDLHLRPRGLACYRVSDTNMLAERAIKALLALPQPPDAVVVTGDLTDGSDPREYALARRILDALPMPVYLVPGNHDGSADMRRAMAGYPGVSEGVGSKICYSADIGELRLIALDTHLPGKPEGALGREQLDWLADQLGKSNKPTVLALHHPPALTGIPHMDRIGLVDAEALAEVVSGHPQVERLICGHVHRAIVASFAGSVMTLSPSTAHQVVLDTSEDAPALFNFEPASYFLHYYSASTGIVSHLAYVESFPGPFHFHADEGVAWPGEELK